MLTDYENDKLYIIKSAFSSKGNPYTIIEKIYIIHRFLLLKYSSSY